MSCVSPRDDGREPSLRDATPHARDLSGGGEGKLRQGLALQPQRECRGNEHIARHRVILRPGRHDPTERDDHDLTARAVGSHLRLEPVAPKKIRHDFHRNTTRQSAVQFREIEKCRPKRIGGDSCGSVEGCQDVRDCSATLARVFQCVDVPGVPEHDRVHHQSRRVGLPGLPSELSRGQAQKSRPPAAQNAGVVLRCGWSRTLDAAAILWFCSAIALVG